MEVRKCVKCGASSAKDSVEAVRSYHRFPSANLKNFERLQKWAQFMYPDQTFQTLESLVVLHKQHKVLCSAHFPKQMIYGSGYLSKFAVPSVEATEATSIEATSTKETQTKVAQVTAQDRRPSASTSTEDEQIWTTTIHKGHVETELSMMEMFSDSAGKLEAGSERVMACRLCLARWPAVRLDRRDLTAFYRVFRPCGLGVEVIECTHYNWVCQYCWVRASQCLKFLECARMAERVFSKISLWDGLQDCQLYPYSAVHTKSVRICSSKDCLDVYNGYSNIVTEITAFNDDNNYDSRITSTNIKLKTIEGSSELIDIEYVDTEFNTPYFDNSNKSETVIGAVVLNKVDTFNNESDISNTITDIAVDVKKYHALRNSGKRCETVIDIGAVRVNKTDRDEKSKTVIDLEDLKANDEYKDKDDTKKYETAGNIKLQENDEDLDVVERNEDLLLKTNEEDIILNQFNVECIPYSLEDQKEEVAMKKLSEKYRGSRYRCEKCGAAYNELESFEAHVDKWHRESTGRYECAACHYRFAELVPFRKHLYWHRRRWRCLRCGYVLVREQLEAHHSRCARTEPLVCRLCGSILQSRIRLRIHTRKHHAQSHNNFICDECGKTFKYKFIIREHMRTHTGAKPFKCNICDKNFTTVGLRTAHMKTHAIREQRDDCYCVECDLYFKNKYLLQQHVSRSLAHVTKDAYKHACSECPDRFPVASQLRLHINTVHLKNRTHPCTMCDKAYFTKGALKSHIHNKHMQRERSREHDCSICERSFLQKKFLQNHIRAIHQRERPYRCDVCEATFGYSAALYTHKRLKHKAQAKR